jgi:hypothetical protein
MVTRAALVIVAIPMPTTSNAPIDLLLEMAGGGQYVLVELRDGSRFIDGVCDVRRQCGEDIVVFHANNCVLGGDIVRVDRVDAFDEATCEAA